MLINQDIIDNTVNKLECRDYKDSAEWVKKFKTFELKQQKAIISEFNIAQAEYIKACMTVLQKVIHIHWLGSFSFKESRKDFYDLKDNTDMSLTEIITEVKNKYYTRIKDRKRTKKTLSIRL